MPVAGSGRSKLLAAAGLAAGNFPGCSTGAESAVYDCLVVEKLDRKGTQ